MDYQKITQFTIEVSKVVGEFLLQENKKLKLQDVELKSKNSLVTYVDKTAEKMIVESLGDLVEGAGFIGEEGFSDKIGEEYNWVIDPLDGTTNYIHGLPHYCISIALMHKNEVVVGVIYEPNLNECFYAWQGSKAYLNNHEIKVSETQNISEALFATGFPYYDYHKMDGYLKVLKDLMFNSRGIRRMGSAAIDMAYVACGRFDAFYEYSLNSWDVAAGALIVKQAGGVVKDFKGGEDFVFGKEIIASSPMVYKDLQSYIDRDFNHAQ
jgi:myo-inositol-1(or 4)-monophosphatase